MNTGQDAGPDGHREAQGKLYQAIGLSQAQFATTGLDGGALVAAVDEYTASVIADLTAERDAARASCAALRKWLEDNAAHGPRCKQQGSEYDCRCGLTALFIDHGTAGQRMLERMAALERLCTVTGDWMMAFAEQELEIERLGGKPTSFAGSTRWQEVEAVPS